MSASNKIKVISEKLNTKNEISMEDFVKEHLTPGTSGNMLHVYETSSHTRVDAKTGSKVTTKYNTLCLKLSDGKYYSARRISFTNQLCSSNAKLQQADAGKEPKYVILRFREFKREEIASGDYVMPKTDGMDEGKIAELQATYDKNIDALVKSNQILNAFHIALENEWQSLGIRLKNTLDENGKPTIITLAADKLVRSTILSKIEAEENGITVIKNIDPPRYTWKIPVFIPHSKTSERAKVHKYRIGQVFMNSDDRFEPAIYDMEASKEASKNGKKHLIEAKLKGTRNGKPCDEVLTTSNVTKYITRKSRMGGYLDISQSSVSGLGGHCLKVLAPHLIVKRHKTEEKEMGLSDESLDSLYNADAGFDQIEETEINFDEVETKVPAQTTTSAPAQTGDNNINLDNIPIHQFQQMMNPQQHQPMMNPQQLMNPYQYQQTMQMPPMQPGQMHQMPPMQPGSIPNLNYSAIINSGIPKPS